MGSPDQDFRYMGLNDLLLEIKQDPNSFLGDEAMENKVLKQVLTLVEDKISEVKNQAVKWCVLRVLINEIILRMKIVSVNSSRLYVKRRW